MSDRRPVMIQLNGVSKTYDGGRLTVLQRVSLVVRAGELVALWGASGSGKSTLLHLMGGLDVPDGGEMQVASLNPVDQGHRLELRRRKVGFVFQLHNLIPDLTVAENLAIPMLALNAQRSDIARRTHTVAEQLGISHRLAHRIQDLSGGERQRTAIGRALMNGPHVLLADEPTGSLDERTAETVFSLMSDLARRSGTTVVVATHERRFAESCDRVLRVRDGRLWET